MKEPRDATVADIMEFVAAKAGAASHPIFGNVASDTKGRQPFNKKRTRAPMENPKILGPQSRNLSAPCIRPIIGYRAVTSFASSPLMKGKSLFMRRSFALIALLQDTSFVTAKRKASVSSEDVPPSIQHSFTQTVTRTIPKPLVTIQ